MRLARGANGRATLATALGVAAAVLGAGPAQAAFPVATNGSVTYQRFGESGLSFEVWSMDSTGSGQRNLTNSPEYEVNPSYSPDGRKIVFVRATGAEPTDIWEMNTDGSGQTRLTNTPSIGEFSPVFSPDGKKIVYDTDDEEPVVEIHLMNADGSKQVQLTNTPAAEETDPDFSPDGQRIVFKRCEAMNCDIYSIAPNGSGLTNVSNTPASISEGEPTFSPDGRRIAFIRGEPGGSEVAVMNADGSSPTLLTSTPVGSPRSPAFSPDGRLVAYNLSSALDIFTINADGSGTPANLSNTPMPLREEVPTWQSIFTCGGRQATIVGSDSGEKLRGTKKPDVIVANGGKDRIKGLGGNDRICGGAGRDRVAGGKGGKDLCRGQAGKDYGGKGCEKGKL
jgi:Tol biopolymer transport system component